MPVILAVWIRYPLTIWKYLVKPNLKESQQVEFRRKYIGFVFLSGILIDPVVNGLGMCY